MTELEILEAKVRALIHLRDEVKIPLKPKEKAAIASFEDNKRKLMQRRVTYQNNNGNKIKE